MTSSVKKKNKDYAMVKIRSLIGNKIIVRQEKGAYQGKKREQISGQSIRCLTCGGTVVERHPLLVPELSL